MFEAEQGRNPASEVIIPRVNLMWNGSFTDGGQESRMVPTHLIPVLPKEINLMARRRRLATKREIAKTYREICCELTAKLKERQALMNQY